MCGNSDLDYAGRAEQALLADPPDYLHEIHRDDVWRIYDVLPAPTLAEMSERSGGSGGVEVVDVGVSSFTIDAEAAGEVVVKVRFSPWMAVAAGDACVREGDDGWSVVVVSTPGRVTVDASLSLPRCFPPSTPRRTPSPAAR